MALNTNVVKAFKFLFSGALMGILLIIFAVAIGYATFIENDYDATTARMLIYNARWFELLMLLMILNFSGMIFTRKLYHKDRLNVLVIHLSLIVIIIGAGLTRYIGYEGIMHIRNGEVSNVFTSSDTYLTIDTQDRSESERIMLSVKSQDFYKKRFSVGEEEVKFGIKNYYDNAVEKIIRTPTGIASGKPIISLIIQGEEHTHSLKIIKGESQNIHELGISFGDTTGLQNVHIINGPEGLQIRLPLDYKLKQPIEGKPTHSKFIPLKTKAKYRFSGMSLILAEYIESGILKYEQVENENEQGAKIVNVSINDTETSLVLNESRQIRIGDELLTISIGTRRWQLPFSLHLKEFQLERYPGSNSPSSFASEVVLIDKKEDLIMPYRIFMNNILTYKGYRFYQSSYDQDEQGTVLSVNHDYWGTLVTYIGYFLLFGSLIVSFFTQTRFFKLLKRFERVREDRKMFATGLLLLAGLFAQAQTMDQMSDKLPIVNADHATEFGRIQVQNQQGRIMPINTMASDMLMKIYKKSTYENLSADQVYLEMIQNPVNWISKPMIKVGDAKIMELIGAEEKFARYTDFFSKELEYKLSEQVSDAYRRKPALRTKFDKELIHVDERVNVYTMVLDRTLFRVFPISDHSDNAWATPDEFEKVVNMLAVDSLYTDYINVLREAKASGNYKDADVALLKIITYQKEAGKPIILSDRKVGLEIFYNKASIFKRLFPIYLILGIFLTGFFFIQVFKPKMKFSRITQVMTGILYLGFLLHTFGLILRWYISGHAPWSNGYESMLYISWVTVLSGLLFMKKSPMTLAVTTMLAGITLFTAHMSWMNPEITNLVPVLKSYWLTIHVATITASYGFLGLGAMLAFMNLIIMIFRSRKNQARVNLILEELSIIIEMALIVGLVLLIIGNFLGGIWANESWGRYWGWDPKETWTLVTIIVYSFILHMNLIPKVKSLFGFNFASLIGFGTVLMTYFGVNYYLSGLHSYAQGDPVSIPTFVYVLVVIISTISLMAAINGHRMTSKIQSS